MTNDEKTEPTLLVLAAGMGSRYGGLKQIDPVGPHGEIIIDYSIFDAIQAGFRKVVFVIRKDIEKDFKEAVGDRFEGYVDVAYVFQDLEALPDGYSFPEGRSKPWGTAHAILAGRRVIKGAFAVINADDFYGAEGYGLLFDYLSGSSDVLRSCLVSFTLRKTLSDHGSVGRGVCQCSEGGFLEGVTEYVQVEKKKGAAVDLVFGKAFSGDESVSMNMWGFGSSFFEVLEKGFVAFLDENLNIEKSEYQIPVVVNAQIENEGVKVSVLPTSSTWFGVTYPGDKSEVVKKISSLVEQGVYPSPLWRKK